MERTINETMARYAAACRRAAAEGAPPPDRPDLDLRGADLERADLRGADLRGADLRGASLYGAYISDADLRGAILDGANVLFANLSGADLRGANLSGANLNGAILNGADLRGVVGLPLDDEARAALRAAVAAQIGAHPEKHDQTKWHSACGTAHCVAGWAVVLAGRVGLALEASVGTPTAAHLLLGGQHRPSFYVDADREDIIRDLTMGGAE